MKPAPALSSLAFLAACASSSPPAQPVAVAAPVTAATPVATPAAPEAPAWTFLRARYDGDGDGRIARAEYTRSEHGFQNLDADKDGVVSAADFDPRWDGVPRVAKFVYGEGGPEVGDPAPLFRLTTTAGEELELASFRDEKPVVLVFGSFT